MDLQFYIEKYKESDQRSVFYANRLLEYDLCLFILVIFTKTEPAFSI